MCIRDSLKASSINENYFLSSINMADKDQVRFVMAGTLTVLNESGSGTLAGEGRRRPGNLYSDRPAARSHSMRSDA